MDWLIRRLIKVRFLLLTICFFICSTSNAQNPLDKIFLQSGAVDTQFNIVDPDVYIELMRVINNNFAKSIPMQLDNITWVTRIRLTRSGMFIALEIKGIDSEKDLKENFDEKTFQTMIKNKVCSRHDLLESGVFGKTTGGNVIYEISNSQGLFLKSYTVNYRDCL